MRLAAKSVPAPWVKGSARTMVLRRTQGGHAGVMVSSHAVSSARLAPSLLSASLSPRRLCSSDSVSGGKAAGAADMAEAEELMEMLLGQGLSEPQPPAPPQPSSGSEATVAAQPHQDQQTGDAQAHVPPTTGGSHGKEKGAEGIRVVELHNLPRNWMHEEIIEFLHQAASHAGIAAPAVSEEPGEEADDEASAIPRVRSAFVQHLHIPFGRRTGLVYGSPRLVLRSPALAHYLVHDLTFDEDDYRNRIYFVDITPPSSADDGHDASGDEAQHHQTQRLSVSPAYVPIEETIEQEQAAALATLELDRYLLAPDLLLDITKMHQRRLVTRGEKVVLRAFTDAPHDSAQEEGEEDGGTANAWGLGVVDTAASAMEAELLEAEEGVSTERRGHGRRARSGRRAPSSVEAAQAPAPRAGAMRDLGHGSMHNMPIPKPYVLGRNL